MIACIALLYANILSYQSFHVCAFNFSDENSEALSGVSRWKYAFPEGKSEVPSDSTAECAWFGLYSLAFPLSFFMFLPTFFLFCFQSFLFVFDQTTAEILTNILNKDKKVKEQTNSTDSINVIGEDSKFITIHYRRSFSSLVLKDGGWLGIFFPFVQTFRKISIKNQVTN
jgi:hypothetical protein